MAAKCAYVEKVGAVYYVRKRIPRAWNGGARSEVVRMSLRTKDRLTALKWGLEALVVFEELLGLDIKDALMRLTEQLIDEQLLQPEEMTGADLIRRRALGSVGTKIIRRAREELQLGENLSSIYRELVFCNLATVEGEAIYDRKPREEGAQRSAANSVVDLSRFDAVLKELGAIEGQASLETAATVSAPAPTKESSLVPVAVPANETAPLPVYTLRFLMDDYFKRDGKATGSDNRSNVQRAVKMFEDLCPEVKTLAVMQIDLRTWDQLYDFVQEIPMLRGQTSPDDLVAFTRDMQSRLEAYPKLSAGTLNSNYLGAITRLIRHANKRRLFTWQAPSMVITESKRATKSKAKSSFSPEEITRITSCPVYLGSASRHHRYSPGPNIYADDQIYWAPLVAMHTGMRVTEIGLLRAAQLQIWFGHPTLVLELDSSDGNAAGEEGYKTGNAVRRVPIHPQLVRLGFLEFWNRQLNTGQRRLFPKWTEHIKGGRNDRPEVHYEADFFNAHRVKWGVPQNRNAKLTFHSFRGFFIQACHDARVNPYTILKWVGHDEDTATRTNEVHRNYLNEDLTQQEVAEIAKVTVPIGPILSYSQWLKR